MPAPQVVAKGRGYVAQRIKEIAHEHDIPIYEDRLLVRALFKIEVGSFIPPELYAAVAEVLAWVNHLTGRYQHIIDRASERARKGTASAG
jgi:flagellar biosynthetic protein FlhB